MNNSLGPQKLALVTSFLPFGHGAETYVLDEALALVRAGIDLVLVPLTIGGADEVPREARELLSRTVAVPFWNGAILKTLLWSLIRHPLFVGRVIAMVARRSASLVDFAKGCAVVPKSLYLGRLLRDHGLAHIHAHSTTSVAVVSYILSQMLRVPWSVSLHSASAAVPRKRRAFVTDLASAQFLRSVNQQGVQELVKMLGAGYAAKLCVIHHGVDIRRARPLRYAYPPSKIVAVATVAVLRPIKGHEYALQACRLLLNRGVTNFHWTFYGDGPLRAQLEKRILELGLSDVVTLAGYIEHDDLMALYRGGKIDIKVLPSFVGEAGQFEGIPHSLKEAMAYGVPVIATDSGGTLELIGDGAGIVVPQKNAVAIADALEQLIKEESLRRTVGERGREKIAREFDVDRNVRELLAAIFGDRAVMAGAARETSMDIIRVKEGE